METIEQRVRLLELSERIPRTETDSRISTYVEVLSALTRRGLPQDEIEIVDASRADRLVTDSGFMSTLISEFPWLDRPECEQAFQMWIATSGTEWAARDAPGPLPDAAHFASPGGCIPNEKFRITGLFTATAAEGSLGMWAAYMECNSGGQLWRKPWALWKLSPSSHVSILNIRSAQSWLELVAAYPRERNGLLHLDTEALAREIDALHFTPHAVLALNGLSLATPGLPTAPLYLDVECTLWLKWVFDHVQLVGRIPADAT